MGIDVDDRGDVCVVKVSGELRFGQPTALLHATSKGLIAEGRRYFVLDMLEAPWVDSSGIGEVVAFHKRARERRGVVKLAMRDKTYTQFTMCNLEKMFEIFDDENDAVASFARPDGGYRERF